MQMGEEGIEGLKGAGLSMPEGVGIQSAALVGAFSEGRQPLLEGQPTT